VDVHRHFIWLHFSTMVRYDQIRESSLNSQYMLKIDLFLTKTILSKQYPEIFGSWGTRWITIKAVLQSHVFRKLRWLTTKARHFAFY